MSSRWRKRWAARRVLSERLLEESGFSIAAAHSSALDRNYSARKIGPAIIRLGSCVGAIARISKSSIAFSFHVCTSTNTDRKTSGPRKNNHVAWWWPAASEEEFSQQAESEMVEDDRRACSMQTSLQTRTLTSATQL